MAQGEFAELVDGVVADAEVCGGLVGRMCFGSGGVGMVGGEAGGVGAVGALGGVNGAEGSEQGQEVGQVGGGRLRNSVSPTRKATTSPHRIPV
ncbi:hypothetical protein [Mycobacterium camsae]|uniref:hypothetical protein n=1 Tax=Mycobacterium gordonae TaxID=1778 RepID=UPI00197D6C50|nr:hypothetical protein [Mycobacterium gordonae]